MKILIVEDEVIPANYLKRLLELEGYEVLETVETGTEAIKIAKKANPDVILMDIMLADNISGCDAAVKINHNNPNIRIIFLTAYSDKEMVDYAIDSNAFGYLLKPYRDQEILATLALLRAQISKNLNQAEEKLTSHDSAMLALAGEHNYNTHTQVLSYRSNEIVLGPQATKLIDLLCKHKNNTIHTDTILEALWEAQRSEQALRSLVYRIRKITIPELIISSSKTGYLIRCANHNII
ncbi:MAG: response regulator transcription factor [Sulfurovum sp.]|nr:response regulator transcription factor [Sulfurovum sp.]